MFTGYPLLKSFIEIGEREDVRMKKFKSVHSD